MSLTLTLICVAFESVAETGTVGVVLVGTQNSRKEKNAMHDRPAWPSITHVVGHVDHLTAPIGFRPELTSGPTESM